MIQISRKSIRLGMAALYSRLRWFSPYDFSCNTSQLCKKKTKKKKHLACFLNWLGGKSRTEKRENPDSFKAGYLHSKSPTLIQE